MTMRKVDGGYLVTEGGRRAAWSCPECTGRVMYLASRCECEHCGWYSCLDDVFVGDVAPADVVTTMHRRGVR